MEKLHQYQCGSRRIATGQTMNDLLVAILKLNGIDPDIDFTAVAAGAFHNSGQTALQYLEGAVNGALDDLEADEDDELEVKPPGSGWVPLKSLGKKPGPAAREGSSRVAKAPPGWGEKAMLRLKKEYPGHPEKAFATAWSLHGRGVSGEDYMSDKSSSSEGEREAVSPPGWGGTVEHMKKHEDGVDNPFALAWWMSKQRGPGGKKKFHPRHKERKSSMFADYDARALDEIVGAVCEPIVREARKRQLKKKTRGHCVFPAESSMVTDDKDHFPINSLAQARNALARVMQYDACPGWYKGSLGGLQKAVQREVNAQFPGLEKRKEEREGK